MNDLTYNTGAQIQGTFKQGTTAFKVSDGYTSSGKTWIGGFDSMYRTIIITDSFSQGFTNEGSAYPIGYVSTLSGVVQNTLYQVANGLPARAGMSAFTSDSEAASWLISQGKYMMINTPYENIITSGCTFYVDSGFLASYPGVGTSMYDIIGGNNGTLNGGVTYSAGTISGNFGYDSSVLITGTTKYASLKFNGTDGYVSASVNGTSYNALTINLWVNATSSAGSIFQWANALSSANAWVSIRNSSGMNYDINVNGGNRQSITLTAGKWTNITITYNSNLWTFYVDGVSVGTYSGGISTNQSNATTVYLGNGNNSYFNGNISICQIFNRALSSAEITRNTILNSRYVSVSLWGSNLTKSNLNYGSVKTSDGSVWLLARNGTTHYRITSGATDFSAVTFSNPNSFTFTGGVLAKNNKIYQCPAAGLSNVAVYDWTAGTTSYITVSDQTANKFQGTVLDKNGNVWCMPYTSVGALRIDTVNASATTVGNIGSSTLKYYSGVAHPNGFVYGIPYNASSVLKINVDTNTLSQFGNIVANQKYLGPTIAPNGKIYAPRITTTIDGILEIDVVSETTKIIPFIPQTISGTRISSGFGQNFFGGSTLGYDGLIYFAMNSTNLGCILQFNPDTYEQFYIPFTPYSIGYQWASVPDNDGNIFYYNNSTQTSQPLAVKMTGIPRILSSSFTDIPANLNDLPTSNYNYYYNHPY